MKSHNSAMRSLIHPMARVLPTLFLLCLGLLSASAAVKDIEVQVDSTASLAETQTKIKVGFTDPKSPGKEGERAWKREPILKANTPVVTDAKAWIVEATKTNDESDKQYPEFTMQEVPRNGDPYMLILALKKPFDKDRTYTVRLNTGYDLQACLLPGWHLVRTEKVVGPGLT